MVKPKFYQLLLIAFIMAAGLSLGAVGCFGSDDGGATDNTGVTQQGSSKGTATSLVAGLTPAEANELSTFKSKDPFIQQAVESTTTSTTGGGGGSGGSTSTTTYRPTTSTTRYPGGGGGSTTTTTKPTSTTTTTAPHLHTLKVLSVADKGGAAAVTFQVDSSVYKDKRVGDVVSTSWGQIKVLDISVSSKVVTLLHGSETLVLSVGQVVYE